MPKTIKRETMSMAEAMRRIDNNRLAVTWEKGVAFMPTRPVELIYSNHGGAIEIYGTPDRDGWQTLIGTI